MFNTKVSSLCSVSEIDNKNNKINCNILFIGGDLITQNIIELFIKKIFDKLNIIFKITIKNNNLLDFFKENYVKSIYNIILIDVRSSKDNNGDGIDWTHKNKFIRYIRNEDKAHYPDNINNHKIFILLGNDNFEDDLSEIDYKYKHYYFINLDNNIYKLFEETEKIIKRAINWENSKNHFL